MTDAALNDFAIRSFRDIADGDDIAARMACRAVLVPQFLWASQQAVEKYLKCILPSNRIPARQVRHNLSKAFQAVNTSGKLTLDLTARSQEFIDYLDTYGRCRYLEVSFWSEGRKIVALDQAVWELRRFCVTAPAPRRQKLIEGRTAPRVRLMGGHLGLQETAECGTCRIALAERLFRSEAAHGPRRGLDAVDQCTTRNAAGDIP